MLAGRLALASEIGFVGMQVQGVRAEIYEALGLKGDKGVLIRDVALGEASDKAGFKRGDLIQVFAGKKINDMQSMIDAAGTVLAGETIKVSVLRAGKSITLPLNTSLILLDSTPFPKLKQLNQFKVLDSEKL